MVIPFVLVINCILYSEDTVSLTHARMHVKFTRTPKFRLNASPACLRFSNLARATDDPPTPGSELRAAACVAPERLSSHRTVRRRIDGVWVTAGSVGGETIAAAVVLAMGGAERACEKSAAAGLRS